MATRPSAPGLFSITTGFPQRAGSRSASRRAPMSTPEPGPSVTMNLTGRCGQAGACAPDGETDQARATASAAQRSIFAIMAPLTVCVLLCRLFRLRLGGVGTHLFVAILRNIKIVAVRIDRPVFRVMAVARTLERRPIAELLAALDDRLVVVDQEAEMIEARRLAVHLIGVDGQVHVAVGEWDAAVLGTMHDPQS